MRTILTLLAAATVSGPTGAEAGAKTGFREGGPVADGVRATCDISTTQHMRNTGGMGARGPGTGSGLCVFTSVEVEARWQNVPQLAGLQKYMTVREGGGYPEKLARVIQAFCKEKSATVPDFVQHTGGDAAFLELALKTGRMPCVTYAGADGFYPRQVAHMVNLAHLDDARAAIIDNNRPGVWVWMTRAEFLDRWRAMNGGWGFVLLGPPPPPYAARPAAVNEVNCLADSPVAPDGFPPTDAKPQPAAAPVPAGQWSCHAQTGNCHWWVNGRCTHVLLPDKTCVRADAFGNPTAERCERPDVPAKPAEPATVNYGLDLPKITAEKRYWVGDKEVGKQAAFESFGADGLTDDSTSFNLTVVAPVGDPGLADRVREAVAGLEPAVRQRLFMQAYPAGHWAAGQFDLKPGVNLRAAARDRVGADLGTIAPDQCRDVESLRSRLRKLIDRTPDQPAPDDGQFPWGIAVAVVVLLALALTRRN